MEISCIVIELKPNSLGRVEEWASYIKENKSSALESLKNEKVTVENFFFVKLEGKDYLIGYMRSKSFEKASEVVKQSLLEIDAYHKKFQDDTWVNGTRGTLMLDLSRIIDENKMA